MQGIVNGAVGVVRGAGVGGPRRPVRLRARLRLLLVGGFAALGLYFLIVSS